MLQRIFFNRLEKAVVPGSGQVVFERDGKQIFKTGSGDDVATIVIRDPDVFREFLRGNTATGEAYMRGEWDTPDIATLMLVFARNLKHYNAHVETGLRKQLSRFYAWLTYLVRKSRNVAARNISRHYDLGNDMFSLFLDAEKMYSCAYYPDDDADLDAAQRAKLDMLCQKAALDKDRRLLDLGCGWGGLSVWAARNYGAKVVSLTLSKEQYGFVRERVEREGLQEQITPVLGDYRDFDPGAGFDSLVSVEMIEAVGPHNFGQYFEQVRRFLKPGGKAVIQAITTAEQRYRNALYDIDFVKEHIFPGGACPSQQVLEDCAARAGLVAGAVQDITTHYVQTLRQWRLNFIAASDRLAKLGYDEKFRRMMIYYFSYCEAGFAVREIEDVQAEYTLPAS